MTHTRRKPYHPMTQDKIERYHRSTKTRSCSRTITHPVNSKNAWPSSSTITTRAATTKSLDSLSPADVYFGRAQTVLIRREKIKFKPPSYDDGCIIL
jgi:putative transposase